MNSNEYEKWAGAVDGVLRRLPDRKAPRGLEERVMAEIARRAALPWWSKSFSHWPVAAKAGFLATCAVLAALLVQILSGAAVGHGAEEVVGSLNGPLERLSSLRDLTLATAYAVKRFLAGVPAFWLYGALAALGSCYAALCAVGAAAYRSLRGPRNAP